MSTGDVHFWLRQFNYVQQSCPSSVCDSLLISSVHVRPWLVRYSCPTELSVIWPCQITYVNFLCPFLTTSVYLCPSEISVAACQTTYVQRSCLLLTLSNTYVQQSCLCLSYGSLLMSNRAVRFLTLSDYLCSTNLSVFYFVSILMSKWAVFSDFVSILMSSRSVSFCLR